MSSNKEVTESERLDEPNVSSSIECRATKVNSRQHTKPIAIEDGRVDAARSRDQLSSQPLEVSHDLSVQELARYDAIAASDRQYAGFFCNPQTGGFQNPVFPSDTLYPTAVGHPHHRAAVQATGTIYGHPVGMERFLYQNLQGLYTGLPSNSESLSKINLISNSRCDIVYFNTLTLNTSYVRL